MTDSPELALGNLVRRVVSSDTDAVSLEVYERGFIVRRAVPVDRPLADGLMSMELRDDLPSPVDFYKRVTVTSEYTAYQPAISAEVAWLEVAVKNDGWARFELQPAE